MGFILHGGTIVTNKDVLKADVLIENGKITNLGNDIKEVNHEIIDVKGCYIFPGGIDPHTHFDLESANTVTADDFASGTKAAIMGGTTTILDFATQEKGKTLKEASKVWHEKADNKSYCNYGFHMAIIDWNEDIAKEMEDMINEGITSFKMYMAYTNTLKVNDGAIYEALEKSKEIGGLIGFHCENGEIIDLLVQRAIRNGNTEPKYHPLTRIDMVEKEAIERLINIAEMTDAPVYVVHLSTKKGLEAIKEGRKRGVKVYTETCPQYLLLNDKCYEGTKEDEFNGAKFVMSPPLRKEYDKEALWEALINGDIEITSTDHCSFNYKGQKELGRGDFSKIPNGAPGVEHRMALLYTYGVAKGRISLNKFVEITSTNAAKIFGMYPEKGTIQIGSDADILVWDPDYEGIITYKEQYQNVDYTPYEGFKQIGRVKHVFLNGEKIVFDGHILLDEPKGKYVYRKANQ